MKNSQRHDRPPLIIAMPGHGASRGLAPNTALHLVKPYEMHALREALAKSRVPLDFQVKLADLDGDNLMHCYIEQKSRTFLALLMAAQEGSFRCGDSHELERLLRVLAYVRKDDDAIPDNQPGGFVDDHREVRAASGDLGRLLNSFKVWRLRHEVPRRWLNLQAQQLRL